MDPEYTIAPRREVCSAVEKMVFDNVLVIAVDSKSQTIQNWYHFSGHPDDWTDDFKRHLAWRMASAAADSLKQEVADKSRQFKVGAPRLAFKPAPSETVLFAIIRPRTETRKKISFLVEFTAQEFGVEVRWWKHKDAGIPYWGARLLLGPISFWLGVDL